jgi:hypothetical protein
MSSSIVGVALGTRTDGCAAATALSLGAAGTDATAAFVGTLRSELAEVAAVAEIEAAVGTAEAGTADAGTGVTGTAEAGTADAAGSPRGPNCMNATADRPATARMPRTIQISVLFIESSHRGW